MRIQVVEVSMKLVFIGLHGVAQDKLNYADIWLTGATRPAMEPSIRSGAHKLYPVTKNAVVFTDLTRELRSLT
jgi:hypothetical protein